MIYLVSFTPLEPYSFGTDQNFDYPGSRKTGKESYFVRSVLTPEQTTVLGTLRYMGLMRADKLNTGFSYSESEKKEIHDLIGEESFSFRKQGQSFGKIHSISPLFLLNASKEEILVRNPYHNTTETEGYSPMRLGEAVATSEGELRLPEIGAYDAKKGHAEGFISLQSKKIQRDLFQTRFIPGNSKRVEGENADKSYFRRETVRLEKGYSFAVLADVEEDTLPKDCIVHMGQKKSAFRAETRTAEEVTAEMAGLLFSDKSASPSEILRKAVEDAFGTGEPWYYALSDLMPEELTLRGFSIIETKGLRNLETVMNAETMLKKLKRSEVRFNLICAGSVFYGFAPFEKYNESLGKAGYNVICKLGGK